MCSSSTQSSGPGVLNLIELDGLLSFMLFVAALWVLTGLAEAYEQKRAIRCDDITAKADKEIQLRLEHAKATAVPASSFITPMSLRKAKPSVSFVVSPSVEGLFDDPVGCK